MSYRTSSDSVRLVRRTAVVDTADDDAVVSAVRYVDAVTGRRALQPHCLHIAPTTLQRTVTASHNHRNHNQLRQGGPQDFG